MSDPAPEYPYNMALDDEEWATEYRKGGFLCIQLGQDLHSRYHILRKLGRGSYATVWLAYDKRDHLWVSIKILRADELSRSKELEHYLNIKNALHVRHLSTFNIVHLIHHFRHTSIHGDVHQCLVFELLGPTVYRQMSQNAEAEIYPEFDDAGEIFRMTIRMLQGMVALHRAGYAWGDPSPKNFAYTFPTEHLSRQQVLHITGPIEETPLHRLDGKPLGEGVPVSLISSAEFPDWPMDDYVDDFRILDLGNTFPIGTRKRYHKQPTFMQPPERIFESDIGYETDLWGAGILIYYFTFATCPLFGGPHDADRIQAMIDYNGPIPQRWHAKWAVMKSHLKPRKDIQPGSVLREKFVTSEHSPDVKLLLPVVQGLMRLKPEARDPAKRALDNVMRICKGAKDEELRELVPTGYQYG